MLVKGAPESHIWLPDDVIENDIMAEEFLQNLATFLLVMSCI